MPSDWPTEGQQNTIDRFSVCAQIAGRVDTGALEGMAAQGYRKQVIRECMENDERLRELGTKTGVDVSDVVD